MSHGRFFLGDCFLSGQRFAERSVCLLIWQIVMQILLFAEIGTRGAFGCDGYRRVAGMHLPRSCIKLTNDDGAIHGPPFFMESLLQRLGLHQPRECYPRVHGTPHPQFGPALQYGRIPFGRALDRLFFRHRHKGNQKQTGELLSAFLSFILVI